MRIAVVGTGYVGLVTGTCFAESGNDVACIDIDAKKIAGLNEGRIPIYEPGLEELVERNRREGRLAFTTDLAAGLRGAKAVFIGVGTPQGADGKPDLRALWSVVEGIRATATDAKLVVVKSTVPVGTNAEVLRRLAGGAAPHRAASNPEFLKEGCAIEDFMRPDRVVAGVRDPESAELLKELHQPFLRTEQPFLAMSPESAEMTKYVANAMLATKISFINEMAQLCEHVAADVNDVRKGIGHDRRIGFQFLHPGPGYGGSCFPKDVRAVSALAARFGLPARMMAAVDEVNEAQKHVLFAKVRALLGGAVAGKTVAVWGLAFKPRTDDVREAPALALISALLDGGAKVQAFDPEAMDNVRAQFGDRIRFAERMYDALDGADLLAVVTEWQEFRNPDFEQMKSRMRGRAIADGRNIYDPPHMAELGFRYASIGRATAEPRG